ncbi:LamG domain-containing protein [bacterium]|nr:LamG domain-containing protein [bacterium]
MIRKWYWLILFFIVTNGSFADKVLELHFDEGTGDKVSDTSGMGNDGKIVDAKWRAGKFGNALEFDGAGSRVEIQDAPELQITAEMTVAAWVLFNSLGASGNHDAIVAKVSTWSFITFRRSNPPYQFAWWDNVVKNLMLGEPKWIASGWVPDVKTWYHLAVTMKSGDKLFFYRDGDIIKESPYPGAIPAGAGLPIWVGKGNGNTENLGGIVDEVVIFNEALSAENVRNLLRGLIQVQPAGKLSMVWGQLKNQVGSDFP